MQKYPYVRVSEWEMLGNIYVLTGLTGVSVTKGGMRVMKRCEWGGVRMRGEDWRGIFWLVRLSWPRVKFAMNTRWLSISSQVRRRPNEQKSREGGDGESGGSVRERVDMRRQKFYCTCVCFVLYTLPLTCDGNRARSHLLGVLGRILLRGLNTATISRATATTGTS